MIRSDSKVMIRVQQKSTATVINFNEIVARAHTREGTEYKSSHERTRGWGRMEREGGKGGDALARIFIFIFRLSEHRVVACSRTAHLSACHSATANPGNELKWVWNNRGVGPVPRQLERGGRVPRAREGTADNAKGRGRERERKGTRSSRESKDADARIKGKWTADVEGLCGYE